MKDDAREKVLERYQRGDLIIKIFSKEYCDITEYQTVVRVMDQCDVIFHVAFPVPIIQPTDANQIISVALGGTLNVLKAAKEKKINRVIITSSRPQFGNGERRDYKPSDWTDIRYEKLTCTC